jgi:hypothetical protein
LVTYANPRFGISARKSIRSEAICADRFPGKPELILLSFAQAVPHGMVLGLLSIAAEVPISADTAFNRQSELRGACRALTHNPGGY